MGAGPQCAGGGEAPSPHSAESEPALVPALTLPNPTPPPTAPPSPAPQQAAVTYAVAGTAASLAIGRPLVGLNFAQEAAEADLRYGLVRVRENAESIAFCEQSLASTLPGEKASG